jgi:hypothetical protein
MPSLRPDPIPVPPLTTKDPFKTRTDLHVPFAAVPMPVEFTPPATMNELPASDASVTFESEEHSIPACSGEIERKLFEKFEIIITELLEITRGAVTFKKTLEKTIVSCALRISTELLFEFPLITIDDLYV